MDPFQELKQLEVELHQPAVRADVERLHSLLHESFVECGRSGHLYKRSEIMHEISKEVMNYSVWSQDFIATRVSEGVVLLTYKSAHVNQKGVLSRHAFRSSLWQLSGQGWKMRFHQGTPTEAFAQDTKSLNTVTKQ